MDPSPTQWTVVVPVKQLSTAKSRLGGAPAERADLALTMAADTIAAVIGSGRVTQVLVVTADARVAGRLGGGDGVRIVDDPGHGLNAALRHGAQLAGTTAVAALPADLPALSGAALAAVLDLAATHRLAVVADADGIGTTLLAAGDPAAFDPAYGGTSFAAHLARGAVDLTAAATAGLRNDVDTVAALKAGQALGLGPETTRLLA